MHEIQFDYHFLLTMMIESINTTIDGCSQEMNLRNH